MNRGSFSLVGAWVDHVWLQDINRPCRQAAADHSTWTGCSCDTVGGYKLYDEIINQEKNTEKSVSNYYTCQHSHYDFFVCLKNGKRCILQVTSKPKDANCLVTQPFLKYLKLMCAVGTIGSNFENRVRLEEALSSITKAENNMIK